MPAQPEFVGAETETDATFIDAPVDPLAANLQQPASQLDGLEPLPPVDGPEPRPLADRPEAAPLAGEPESILPGEGPDPSADLRASRRPETIQQVWVPFRSQTSAEGFARRLSDETQHPFGIDRRGPGRYQVFFAYVDEDERQRLLEQVRPLLGTAAP